jgi:WD40 repeat protein
MVDDREALHLVITVHGIRTYGRWQSRLQKILYAQPKWQHDQENKEIFHYRYGVLTLLSFVVPFLRNLAVKQFREYIQDIFKEQRWERVDIVAHSFGTYLVFEALADPRLAEDVKVHTVIFCGSVLSPNRNIGRLVGPGRRIGRIINECGIFDGILLLTLAVYGVGMAGRLGLQGFEGRTLRNRYHNLGHSGYFEHRDGLAYDGFMRRWWIPLLLNDVPAVERDRRPERPPFSDRLWRLLGENGSTVTVSMYAVVLLSLAATFGYLWRDADRAKRDALAQRNQALLVQSRFLADLARQRFEAGDSETAMLLGLEGLPDEHGDTSIQRERPYANQAEIALYKGLHTDREIALLDGHLKGVYRATYSPDGKLVVTISNDNTARVWEADTWQTVAVLSGHSAPIAALAFSPNSARIATASADKTVRLWDAKSGEQTGIVHHMESVGWVTFSVDGNQLLTASLDKTARVSDVRTGDLISALTHERPVLAAIFGNQRIITLDTDATVRLWDANSFKQLTAINIPRQGYDLMAFFEDQIAKLFSTHGNGKLRTSADGRRVMAVWARTGVVIDVEDGKVIFNLSEPEYDQQILDADLSLDGQHVATGGLTGTVRLWEVEHGRQTASLSLGLNVTHVAFAPNSSLILATSREQIQILDGTTLERKVLIVGHASAVEYATLSPDGRRIVSASMDGTARVWDAVSPLAAVTITTGASSSEPLISFSADGARLLSIASMGLSAVWDAKTGKKLVELKDFDDVDVAAFNPGGETIIAASRGNLSGIWDAQSGQKIGEIGYYGAWTNPWWIAPFGIALPSLSKNLLLTTTFNDVLLWDVAAGAQIKRFGADVLTSPNAIITPDGTKVLTQDHAWLSDNFVRAWDPKSGRNVATFAGGNPQMRAWNFDGSRTVTKSSEGTPLRDSVTVWDSETGFGLVTLKADLGQITQASISRNGARVVTLSDDQRVRVWNGVDGTEVAQFAAMYDGLIRITPDGSRIALSSREKTGDVAIVDAATGSVQERIHIADLYSAPAQLDVSIEDIGFSVDGSRMFVVFGRNSSSSTFGFAYWETVGWKPVLILRMQPRIQWKKDLGLVSTQNGKCLVGVAPDNSVRILDVCHEPRN